MAEKKTIKEAVKDIFKNIMHCFSWIDDLLSWLNLTP